MKFAKIGCVLALLVVQWGSSATPSGTGPNSHWILQFKGFRRADLSRELAQRGVRVLEYVADSVLIVSFRQSSGRQSPNLAGLNITWTGQLTAAARTAPGLETAPAFLVVFHSDVPQLDAERVLEGFHVLDAGPLSNHAGSASWPVDAPHYLVAADYARLPQLAAHDEVSCIYPGGILPGGTRITVDRRPGPITEAGLIGEHATGGTGWPSAREKPKESAY
jgi:hypothetical protein